MVLHGAATLQEIIILQQCFKHISFKYMWRGGGCLWLCFVCLALLSELIVGKARALCLSCDGEGIVKGCFIICVD